MVFIFAVNPKLEGRTSYKSFNLEMNQEFGMLEKQGRFIW